MIDASDPLAKLRDIHTPAPITFWPPAPGWWILLLLGIVGITLGVWWARHRRFSTYRAAQRQLEKLRESYLTNHEEDKLVSSLSTLIRRYSMTAYGREHVAGLTGDAWLNFLDETGQTKAFSGGAGKVLKSVPYGGRESVKGEALIDLVSQWLKKAKRESS